MEPKPKRSWKGKGSSAGSGASKKPRVAAGEEAVAAEMSDVYRSGAFIQGLALRWRNKEMMKKDDGGGTVLYNAPYQLCVLPEFIASMASGTEDCLLQLREELSRLKFMEKNNDLYQFRQANGILMLNGENSPANITFYTTLVSLSQIALRLDSAVGLHNSSSPSSSSSSSRTCKNSNGSSNVTSSSSVSLELRALSAVVSQVSKDACNYSDDLKWFKTPCITAFRGVLQEQVLPWLQQVTGIELKSQIDITCSKYEFTDYLLCHDDQLEGRRIAFIFYLAQDWTAQDGGNLELFDTDETGQPSEVVVSIPPVWNNFIFFEVTPASFHQVSEVLHSMKTRLSISGWFHGPQVPRPQPQPFPPPSMTPPLPADLGVLWEWVSPIYLDIGTQTQIQSQFEEESQIQLPNFLLESKYEELCKELQGNQCKWIVKGPPNKSVAVRGLLYERMSKGFPLLSRHLHVAEEGSLPPSTAGLPQLLSCEPFCRLLSHLTGLDLAKDVIRLDTVREGDDGGPCCSSAIPRDCSNGQAAGAEVPLKSERVAGTDRVPLNGATTSENQCTEDGGDESSRERVAEVGGEMLNLRPGDYTLLSDQDPSIGEAQLHLLLHLSCEHTDWSGDCGGMRVYVARDGDEELLSVCPSGNALSLVFCDQDTVSFTKYINHRTKLSGSSLFCAAFTYKETL